MRTQISSPFVFEGEESARFTRFALSALAAGLDKVQVQAEGREPLTARPVSITGTLVAGLLDGYIRYITIKDDQSDIAHNVGGSNSTRSIAARRVQFRLTPDEVKVLNDWAEAKRIYVPRLIASNVEGASDFLVCEAALTKPTEARTREVLALLGSENPQVRTEAMLTLRGLSTTINANRRLRLATETAIIKHCLTEGERDAVVAGIEDLGYIGEDQSKVYLAKVLGAPSSDQACWAATIALSRLSGGEEVWRPLLGALKNDSEWVPRAALLCLARRAQPDLRGELEETFAQALRDSTDDLQRRYACLGLSRFKEYSVETWAELARVLADESVQSGTRGYAALAISSAYQSCPPEIAAEIREVLTGILEGPDDSVAEIDSVWALEFLGELASITGLPGVASALYRKISDAFSDWRSHYYLAISSYEQGEAEALRGDGENAIVRFAEALRQLSSPMNDVPDEASVTVEFRKTIVQARRQLQVVVSQWRDTDNPDAIRTLIGSVNAIREQYQRYANPDAEVGRDRQLVQREVDYLRTTVAFMELLGRLLKLDAATRGVPPPEEALQTALLLVAQAMELAGKLERRTQAIFSLPLQRLLIEVKNCLELIREAAGEKLPSVDRLRVIWGYLDTLREAFWQSSWPMPGRACPVYGLGRAHVGVRAGAHTGSGAWDDPVVLEPADSLVLPLFIRIIDMATGGNAQLNVEYRIGSDAPQTIPVHAVEDEYPLPIDLARFESLKQLAVEVRAIFFSRDCTQEAFKHTFFVKIGTRP